MPLLLLFTTPFTHLAPGITLMCIAARVIFLRGHHDTNRSRCKVSQLTPHSGWNQNTPAGIIHNKGTRARTIIHLNLKATRYRKYRFVASPVRMAATHLARRNLSNPEHALHLKGYMSSSLQESQAPAFIHILRQLQQRNALRHDFFFHRHRMNFGAKIHFSFENPCIIQEKHLPLHRI